MSSEHSIQSLSYNIGDNPIHFLRWGNGPELLIAIPGYGERAATYNEWECSLAEHFTCYALDLPFHGSSQWKNQFFKPADLIRIIESIREKEAGKPISLAAYSMGGRLLLSSLPLIDFPIHRLILIAPDGIYTPGLNAYMQFAGLATPLSSFLLNRPSLSGGILSVLFRLKLLNRRNLLFLQRQLIHDHRRVRLLFWSQSLPHFPVKKSNIIHFMNSSIDRTILVTGKKDQVVPAKGLRRFGKKLRHCTVIEINSNHQILEQSIGATLLKYIDNEG